MRQIECPDCGAPMWEGKRCPWDRGTGCRGRELDKAKPARKRVNTAPEVPKPRPRVQRPPREPRPQLRPTCHPDRKHVARGRCRPCYDAEWHAAHPGYRQQFRATEYARRRERRLAA